MSFRNLTPGNIVNVRFNGSKVYGNEPYELSNLQVVNTTPDTITFVSDEIGEFDIYFHQNRWRYGSSAEVAKLLAVHTY